MQLQLSLHLADELYDLLLMTGEPVDYLDAARRLLALRAAPADLCRPVMASLVAEDRRFCWADRSAIGLADWRLADPDLAEVTFVVVDLETTGARPGEGKITEIGAVRVECLREAAHFETLVNPLRSIPPKVTEITGITPRMVGGAPRIEEIMPHFLDFLRDGVIVAHNASFDLGFLNYELGRLKGRRLGEGAIDTVSLARCMAPGLPNYRLATVAEALGSQVVPVHRALADAQATAHIFLTLMGRLQERGVTRLNEARSIIDPGHKRDRHKLALTRDLPRTPGAYLFQDRDGTVLYVGKAERLRDRVRSYFLSHANHPRKVRQAVRRLHRVTWEETGSPLAAVVREQALILEHRPACNVHGRRPENYVYLKAGGAGAGMRLYAGSRRGTGGATTAAAPLAIGPFRGRARVKAALELVTRCYPVRRCRSQCGQSPCLFGHTGSCLAPCRAEDGRVAEHDALVRGLLDWLAGEDETPLGDPVARAQRLMRSLAKQHRFEEAERIRQALEHLGGLRRSYLALREARELRVAVLWPLPETAAGKRVQLDLVWDGTLRESLTLQSSTAALEIGRALRALPWVEETERTRESGRGPQAVAVDQEELDTLLAVRRWLIETPDAISERCPSATPGLDTGEIWRGRLLERARPFLEA